MARFVLGLLAAAAALVAAVPASAKEGVKATLTSGIPLDARAGNRLKVAWTLSSVDEHGRRHAFGANGVYVRLLSASGARAETGVAPSGAYTTGRYAATVVVPKGGIADVQIGLQGWTSGATGTRRADLLFPITNDPVPGVARIHPDTGSKTWLVLVVAASMLALAVLSTALALHRKRLRSRQCRSSGAPSAV